MFDDPEDDDVTEFEEQIEQTAFDPNPWGARQRMLPSRTFVARHRRAHQAFIPARTQPRALPPLHPPYAPQIAEPASAPLMQFYVPAMTAPAVAIAGPPWFPQHAQHWPVARRRTDTAAWRRYAAPLCGAIAVVLFAIAYLAKPSSGPTAVSAPRPRTEVVVPVTATMPVAAPSIETRESDPADDSESVEATEPGEIDSASVTIEPDRPAADRRVKRTATRKTMHRVSRRRPVRLDAIELSTPLGRMRPGHRM